MKTIGIIGGMGPEATNRLCSLITANTAAVRDQDHIPVIAFNNSAIPDRVAAIFAMGRSPVPELVRTARALEAAGADFLLMPCNTAHYFFDDVQAAVSVPLVNMIELTVKHIIEEFRAGGHNVVGLLGSTPTVECGLYETILLAQGQEIVVPDENDQKLLVMDAIFGEQGIKAGMHEHPARLLQAAANKLIAAGATIIVAGCTEISLVLNNGDLGVPIVDPLQVVADYAVRHALAESPASLVIAG